jgi:beta-galactosidase
VHLDAGSNAVKATAIIGGATLTDALEWRYSGKPSIVRIKAGDIAGFTTSAGLRFGSDMYFEGGTAKGISLSDTRAKDLAVAAAEPRLYDSYRVGDFSYHLPLLDGRYKVTLHFVEPVASTVGERVFDVRANGTTIVRHLDIFAAVGGLRKGYTRSFPITVKSGLLSLDFHATKGQAVLSACEIVAE